MIDTTDRVLLPVCAWCKRVSVDGRSTWQPGTPGQDVLPTHGLCPTCAEVLFGIRRGEDQEEEVQAA